MSTPNDPVAQARATLDGLLDRWDAIPTYGGIEDVRHGEVVRSEIEAAKDALIAAAEARGAAKERERRRLSCQCDGSPENCNFACATPEAP